MRLSSKISACSSPQVVNDFLVRRKTALSAQPGLMIERHQLTNGQCGLPLRKKEEHAVASISELGRLTMHVDEKGVAEKGKWHGRRTAVHG